MSVNPQSSETLTRQPLTKAEAGRLGGLTTAHRLGPEGTALRASRAGSATLAKHGRAHFARAALIRWGRLVAGEAQGVRGYSYSKAVKDTPAERAAHTPGPWAATQHGVIVGAANEYVGLIAGQSNQKANAHLVAAAPELLEALMACVAGIKHATDCGQVHCKQCDKADEASVAARATIKKAGIWNGD